MVVHHASRLHQRVTDGRADEFESALNQIPAHRVGFGCARRKLSHSSTTILFRFAAEKTPEVSVEAAKLFPDREKRFRILDRRRNLQPVPHDAGVAEQPFHIARAVARDLFRAKTVERLAIVLPFFENRRPAQPALRALEDQKLKQLSIVMNWYDYIACFFAGMFLANAVPHFTHGISGDRFPTPFARPPGKGLSSPTVNVVWALFNLVVGYILFRIEKVSSGSGPVLISFFAGIAAISIWLSVHFTKKSDR